MHPLSLSQTRLGSGVSRAQLSGGVRLGAASRSQRSEAEILSEIPVNQPIGETFKGFFSINKRFQDGFDRIKYFYTPPHLGHTVGHLAKWTIPWTLLGTILPFSGYGPHDLFLWPALVVGYNVISNHVKGFWGFSKPIDKAIAHFGGQKQVPEFTALADKMTAKNVISPAGRDKLVADYTVAEPGDALHTAAYRLVTLLDSKTGLTPEDFMTSEMKPLEDGVPAYRCGWCNDAWEAIRNFDYQRLNPCNWNWTQKGSAGSESAS